MKVKLSYAISAVVLAVVLTIYGFRIRSVSEKPIAGRPIAGALNIVKDTSDRDGYVTTLRITIFDGENNADFVKEIDTLVGKRVILRVVGDSSD